MYARHGRRTAADARPPQAPLALYEWSHVAVSFNALGRVTMYVNGESVSSDFFAPVKENKGNLWLGNPWQDPARALLADVRYYRKEVSPKQVLKAVKDRKIPVDKDSKPLLIEDGKRFDLARGNAVADELSRGEGYSYMVRRRVLTRSACACGPRLTLATPRRCG
jgi:hypothetical protein